MKMHQIDFKNFTGYLNNLYYYGGYGGMNWNDMYEVQAAFINEHTWCDTGYNNVLTGQGEGITLGTGGFQSADVYRPFTLVKGTFASAWETNQPVYFSTYTYTAGTGFVLKATDEIVLGQNAKTINFGHFGSDFKDISKITFVSGAGAGGSTCSYGTPTYGYILVMDNLEYHWNAGGGKADRLQPIGIAHRGPQHLVPHLTASFAPLSAHDGQDTAGQPANHGVHDAYHADFHVLPQAEHFGP
jgi:hypothetical protein